MWPYQVVKLEICITIEEVRLMDMGLRGKTVIVSGGGGNIGYGISLAFAEEAVNLVISDIDEAQAQKVAKKAEALGAKALAANCDARESDQVSAMVKGALDEFKVIDVLVNVVGGASDYGLLFTEKPRESWRDDLDLNIISFLNCTRAVLDHMIERKRGAVVSIASEGERWGLPGLSIYNGAKAAVIGMTKTLAREYGEHGIRFNVVSPGLIVPTSEEEMGELSGWRSELGLSLRGSDFEVTHVATCAIKRVGRPSDIGKAVVFLASECASYITGQTLSVTGGSIS
jgi:NAD(P)-dependent dehydrogenase (short-subunit alcohol dehydrogenase family)